MGWKEYYQTCPESFCARFGRGPLGRVLKKSPLSPLSQKESLRLVLGGFSPNSPAAAAFINYCAEFRPGREDEVYLLDFNRQPFRAAYLPQLPKEKFLYWVQADLTKMPFTDNSLDLIFLDSTSTFMSDEQLSCFNQEAARTLTETGLVISFFPEPFPAFLLTLHQIRSCAVNRTRVYCRTAKDYLDGLKQLKLVWHLQDGAYNALFLGKQNSPYPAFFGSPYSLEAVNANP